MSDTVYYYKIWCNTDSKYEYVWSDDEPTVCPVNNAHSVDTSSVSIENQVSTTRVKIIEENIPTGENFMAESHCMTYATGPNVVSNYDYSWPFPITVLDVSVVSKEENEGDEIKLCVSPDTIIGVIGIDAATGATGATVSSTVIDNLMVGYEVSLFDGATSCQCGRVVNIDTANSKISWENPTERSYEASGPTYVRLSVYVMNNYVIGPPHIYPVGEGKIGGSYVPANTIVRAYITNKDNYSKAIIGQIEYLY